MRILYILPSASLGSNSVKKKVVKQIQYLNTSDIKCDGVFFSNDVIEITRFNEFINYIPVKPSINKYFKKIGNSKNQIKSIYEFLVTNKLKYDVIYFRYPSASIELFNLVKKFKNVVFEINDNSIMTIRREKTRFSIRRSLVLHLIQEYYWPLFNELFFGTKIFNNCIAISCVSNELFKNIKKEYKINRTIPIIIANGIDVASLPVRNYHFKNNKTLKMIMLKGASTNAVYLGNDRIIKSVANYKGDWEIKLIFAGECFQDEIQLVKSLGAENRVKFVGYLSDSDIDKYVNDCDIAIGTLAAFRSNIDEISSLKAREY